LAGAIADGGGAGIAWLGGSLGYRCDDLGRTMFARAHYLYLISNVYQLLDNGRHFPVIPAGIAGIQVTWRCPAPPSLAPGYRHSLPVRRKLTFVANQVFVWFFNRMKLLYKQRVREARER